MCFYFCAIYDCAHKLLTVIIIHETFSLSLKKIHLKEKKEVMLHYKDESEIQIIINVIYLRASMCIYESLLF